MDIKKAFALRLQQVLLEKNYPPKFQGQQEQLARDFDVTPKTAGNWLNGEKMPTHERMIEMALRYNVCIEWLETGRGLKYPLSEREQDLIQEIRTLDTSDQERIYRVTRAMKPIPTDRAA